MRSATPRAFDPSGPSWSEIKPLYIERQNNKCAYCERRLPDADGVDRDEQRDARGELERLLDGTQLHTSCLRAFVDLFQREPGAAAEVAREARILWTDSG